MILTADQVTERITSVETDLTEARYDVSTLAREATTPADGRALVVEVQHLSDLLLDHWQLDLIRDLVDHENGDHGTDCTSELCSIDDDELVEMADRWAKPWPTLAAWLRMRALCGLPLVVSEPRSGKTMGLRRFIAEKITDATEVCVIDPAEGEWTP